MGAILQALLTITVSSMVLYASVLLFKAVFRKRLSASLNFALWGLLILRLTVPVTWDSGFSLIVLPAPPAQVQQISVNQPAAPQSNVPTGLVAGQIPAQPGMPAAPATGGNTKPIGAIPFDWQTAVVLLWAGVALGLLLYRSILLIRMRHALISSATAVPKPVMELVERCKRALGIRADIPVSVQRWQHSPALTASIKPVLLLPERMLRRMDAQQLEFGVRHELAHWRHRDHLTSLLLMALRCVWWFNPVVYLAFPQMETDMESACDARVTGSLGHADRKRYVETMIDLGGGELRTMLGMGARCDKKSMEKRIRSVYMKKKSSRLALVTVLMAATLLFVACFTTACLPKTGPAAAPADTQNTPSISATPQPATPAETTAPAETQTPAATETAAPTASADSLDKAVGAAVLGKLWDDSFGEVKTEGHVILSTELDKDGNTVVYAVASYCTYGFENGLFTVTSGSGSIPAVITLAKNADGYTLVSYKEPDDGSLYDKSLKKLFPEALWPKVQHADQFTADLQAQKEAQAKAYLKSIGRNEEDVHSDYVEKELFHIQAEASNTLLAMPVLGNYPTWNGSRETVENGIRYMYIAMEDDLSDYSVITYTKKTADGKVVEQFKYKVVGGTVTLLQ